MTDPERPDEIVTLTRCDQLIAAQLLCGRLDADGIECFIPDEHMANQTWHLSRAIGGIRVQVRQIDLERAKQILAEPGAAELLAEAVPGKRPNGAHDEDDGTIGPGDRAAYRAMRVALVSLWLMGRDRLGQKARLDRPRRQRARVRVDGFAVRKARDETLIPEPDPEPVP